jgi:hypothetical protein
MNVINIRGTTGSGKTTIVRNLIKDNNFSPAITLSEGVACHISDKYVVIGPYKSGSNFGGVDAIKKISYVEPAILKALEIRPTVIFEGLLISHSYERWLEFSKKIKAIQHDNNCKEVGMIWAFIVPPFKVNIQRLRTRNNIPPNKTLREIKGDNYISNFIKRYQSIQRILKKAKIDCAFGHLSIRELDYINPNKELKNLLRSDIIGAEVLKRTGNINGFFKHGVCYARQKKKNN